MLTKIVVLTTDGDSREDGSVYYSSYLLVSSDTLKFDEKVFSAANITVDSIDGIADEEDEGAVDHAKLIEYIRGLGYTVEQPDTAIVTTSDN